MRVLLLGVVSLMVLPLWATEKMCHYSSYQWNVNAKQAVNYQQISLRYRQLKSNQVDAQTGCSVCIEDQVLLKIGEIKPFLVCKKMAAQLKYRLTQLLQAGQPIVKIVGYRVGMTRGKLDSEGNRTGFSNHSFGIAIDINDEQNGLYDHCLDWSQQCRLRKGGHWNPEQAESLIKNSPIVIALKKMGFKWGGEIKGQQKDFMHFSPSGY